MEITEKEFFLASLRSHLAGRGLTEAAIADITRSEELAINKDPSIIPNQNVTINLDLGRKGAVRKKQFKKGILPENKRSLRRQQTSSSQKDMRDDKVDRARTLQDVFQKAERPGHAKIYTSLDTAIAEFRSRYSTTATTAIS